METYITQLIEDIDDAIQNVPRPYMPPGGVDIWDVPLPDEEERNAPIRDLEEWTGISKDQLPPVEKLSDDQVTRLLKALTLMLNAYNWSLVLQIEVPERIQYLTIRENFDQRMKVKVWDYGYFQMCRPGTLHGKCTLGEYCQCAFFEELHAGFIDEDLTEEEERRLELEIEIRHLKRKYDDDWMRYYPYHLDPDYDDEDGNPYDYGFGEED